jgi:quinol monooxygenase YgiN
MGIVLKVEVTGKPGRGDAIAAVFVEMARLVADHEPGCLRYDVARSRDRVDDFVIWEIYADQAAFDAHRRTRHFAELMEGRLADLVEDRARTVMDLAAAADLTGRDDDGTA